MSLLEVVVNFCFWLLCCLLAAAIVVGVKYWARARRERRARMAKVEGMLPEKTYVAYRTPWAHPREHYIDTPNYLKEEPEPMHPALRYDPVPCKGCGHLLPDFAMSDLVFRGSPNITKHNGTYCSVCEIIVRDAVVEQAEYEGIDPNYATARWTDRKED